MLPFFKSKKSTFYFFPILWLLLACKENPRPILLSSQEVDLRNQIVAVMNYWYLWNKQVPEVDIYAYETSQEFLNAMINNEYDRWSYITEERSFDQYYKEGRYAGHGFGLRYDTNGALRITLVYPGSPADSSGVTRGFEILEVNGRSVTSIDNIDEALGDDVEGVVNQFKMRTTLNEVVDVSIHKSNVEIVTVLDKRVIQQNGQKVGYLVFNNFIERAEQDLNEAFNYFASEKIDELVLDLRYNGGGILGISAQLSSMITKSANSNKILVELSHNSDREENNVEYFFEPRQVHLGLDRLVVITSESTASASEIVINCLKPYMEVVTIGSNSYGKPVGSYGFRYEGHIISPISFKVANVDGVADYFEGLSVNSYIPDDITKNFGNLEEDCLKEALYYLETGGFTSSGSKIAISTTIAKANKSLLTGFRAEIGAF